MTGSCWYLHPFASTAAASDANIHTETALQVHPPTRHLLITGVIENWSIVNKADPKVHQFEHTAAAILHAVCSGSKSQSVIYFHPIHAIPKPLSRLTGLCYVLTIAKHIFTITTSGMQGYR